MNENPKNIAQQCLDGAYNTTMDFPEIIGTLIRSGFESYHVDYLRNSATYYLSAGDSIELSLPQHNAPIERQFNAAAMQAAIKDAQQKVAGYTYQGFCERAAAAGCVGYIVSFPGKRVVYLGRTAEMHVEYFPQ